MIIRLSPWKKLWYPKHCTDTGATESMQPKTLESTQVPFIGKSSLWRSRYHPRMAEVGNDKCAICIIIGAPLQTSCRPYRDRYSKILYITAGSLKRCCTLCIGINFALYFTVTLIVLQEKIRWNWQCPESHFNVLWLLSFGAVKMLIQLSPHRPLSRLPPN